jgi:hypothetical protein
MRLRVAGEVCAYSSLQFFCGDEPIGFGHRAFAVHPVGLDRIQPRALARQGADDDAHALAAASHHPVVGTDPLLYRMADVPAGVVPDEEQRDPAELKTVLEVAREGAGA